MSSDNEDPGPAGPPADNPPVQPPPPGHPPPALPPHPPPTFEDALKELLSKYDKQSQDLASLVNGEVPSKVVEHVHKIQDSSKTYRRLRHFSGKEPPPGGELPWDTWFQLADQMLKESGIADKDKKTRITESLLPPALSVVRKLPASATASEYLSSLDKVFGAACDGADLYSIFRETHQEPGEVPSAFLTRLETKLDRVVHYDGIDTSQVDKARLNQFIRGCVYDEALVNALQLRQKKTNPPDYLTLLKDVRVEETAQQARVKMRQGTKASMKVHHAQVPPSTPSADTSLRKEVEELKKLVQQLQLAPSIPAAQAQAMAAGPPQPTHCSRPQGPRRKPRGPLVCFQCGEYGHRKSECTSASNPTLVQRRLIEKFCDDDGQGNGHGYPRRSTPVPKQY
ncbi:paraneoplastic antigen Ma3 homolog [Amphiura filiformis]|uniref:paraneoplastic antigen Ma3 homolog n=1 Tax=Amphiura filiformis TaxID=82378 RepID=UPI003B220DD6